MVLQELTVNLFDLVLKENLFVMHFLCNSPLLIISALNSCVVLLDLILVVFEK